MPGFSVAWKGWLFGEVPSCRLECCRRASSRLALPASRAGGTGRLLNDEDADRAEPSPRAEEDEEEAAAARDECDDEDEDEDDDAPRSFFSNFSLSDFSCAICHATYKTVAREVSIGRWITRKKSIVTLFALTSACSSSTRGGRMRLGPLMALSISASIWRQESGVRK